MTTTCDRQNGDISKRLTPAPQRRAITSFELIVAFSLVATVIGLSAPLIVRHGRLLATARHYRLAIEELTNQLERIAALPPTEIDATVDNIEVSKFAAEKLPGAELTGEIHDAEYGRRVTLHIVWDEPQRRENPLAMTAWVATAPSSDDDVKTDADANAEVQP